MKERKTNNMVMVKTIIIVSSIVIREKSAL
jgi:hypothetical protein